MKSSRLNVGRLENRDVMKDGELRIEFGVEPEGIEDSHQRTKQGLSSRSAYLLLAFIVIMGLAIRLVMAPHNGYRGDIQAFRLWAVRLVDTPLADFYTPVRSVDHLPGDLWLLWGIAHMYHWISPQMNVQATSFLVMLKVVPSIADAGIALISFLIARRFSGIGAGLLAAAFVMFNPALIFVSATWGQWDSVSAFFMVVGLWLLLRGDPEWSLPFFTYAALIKPQLGLLAVLAVLAWWRWSFQRQNEGPAPERVWLRRTVRLALGAIASLTVFLLVDLPFGVGLPFMSTRFTIVERISNALNRYKWVSANAFNFWGIFGKATLPTPLTDSQVFVANLSYRQLGEILLGLAITVVLALFCLRPTRDMALCSSLAITFSLFMFPTRIHERYLMPAVVISLLVSAIAPKLRWLGIALSLTFLVNLYYVYHPWNYLGFGQNRQPSELIPLAVSAANVFMWLVVFTAGLLLAFGPVVIEQRGEEPQVATESGAPWAVASARARTSDRTLGNGTS